METYIVGVDGSPSATLAACRAAQLARVTGAHLRVVCAHETPVDTVLRVGSDTFEFTEATRAEAVAEAAVSQVRGVCADADWTVAPGDAAAVLVAEAEASAATLIVVGSHGLSGLSELLGSVTEKVLHHAPCDVLVVRAA